MTADAFARSLRQFCRRKPFRPYILEFHTGVELTIVHPEAVTIFGEVVVYLEKNFCHHLFDASSVCQLMDVPEELDLPED